MKKSILLIVLLSLSQIVFPDPNYKNGNGTIITASKKWTVRKLEQLVSIWEKTNIRDKPGLDGNVVSHTHNFELGTRSPQETYEILAITEETETIDKFKDHWLKIEYEPGRFGWIFGGYASVERGGMKYYLPEDCVIYQLTWY